MVDRTGSHKNILMGAKRKNIKLQVDATCHKVSKQFISALKKAITGPDFIKGVYVANIYFSSDHYFDELLAHLTRYRILDVYIQPHHVICATLEKLNVKVSGKEHEFLCKNIFPLLPKNIRDKEYCSDNMRNQNDLLKPYLDNLIKLLGSLR